MADGSAMQARSAAPWAAAAADRVVRSALAATSVVTVLEVVGEVGSTQDVARTGAAGPAPALSVGTLVLAERQTAGRGRIGRAWDDDARPGASLAATLLLAPPSGAGLVPHAVGLAVAEAVGPWLGGRAVLKWPNDVVVRGPDGAARKVAGILVERLEAFGDDGSTLLLVGIGLNVDRRHLPPEHDRAGVADLAGADVDRAELLARLVRGLDVALGLLAADPVGLVARYRPRSDTRGRAVRVTLPDGTDLRGRAEVDDDGRLILATVSGPRTVVAGTVRDDDGLAEDGL